MLDLEDLAIKAALAGILCFAAWGAWHAFTGHYEAIGAARVQAKWDVDKAVRVKRASDLAALYAKRMQDDAETARKERDKDDAKIAGLEGQVASLSTIPTLHFSAGAWSVWNAATVFANGGADPAAGSKPAGGAGAVSRPAATAGGAGASISEQAFDAYQLKASAAYRDAVRLFHAVRQRYDDLRSAKLPEKTQ